MMLNVLVVLVILGGLCIGSGGVWGLCLSCFVVVVNSLIGFVMWWVSVYVIGVVIVIVIRNYRMICIC